MSGILTTPTIEFKIAGGAVATVNILECAIHLGCTKEISTFAVVVDNSNPDYNAGDYSPGEAKEPVKGGAVTIKIKRGAITGSTKELITGVLEAREYIDEAEEYQFRNIVVLSGRCNGQQLFNRKYDGDLIDSVGTGYQAYKRVAGEAESLVAYLIDNYTSLSHIRETSVATGDAASSQNVVDVTDGDIFTAGDLVKIYDDSLWEYNKIASIDADELTMTNVLVNSYTTAANLTVGLDLIRDSDTTYTKMEYIHEVIFDIIKWIADTADTSGTIGYDSRVEYDGKYAFLPRGHVTEDYSLSAQVQLERYLDDATRIKNKIWVYGKADKPYPYDQTVDDGNDYSDHFTESYSQTKSALASNAASGQKVVVLASSEGSNYAVGNYCWLVREDVWEQCQIANISTDTLTMEDDLISIFTTANHSILVLADTSAERGWAQMPQDAYNDISVGLSVTQAFLGTYSIMATCNNSLLSMPILMMLEEGDAIDCNKYKEIRGLLYFDFRAPRNILITLYSGDSKIDTTTRAATSLSITPNANEWTPFTVSIGSSSSNNWGLIGSNFDWENVKVIKITVIYPSAGTNTFFLDRFYFIGKRWGGGTDNSVIDGFAESSSSQSTYGIKEHVVVSDLLLSDKECESKAQSLLVFYGNPRVTIIPDSKTVDWADYPIIPGNKVAVNLTPLGISDDFRIDAVDIKLTAEDHELIATFEIDDTPPRTADYLQGIVDRLKIVEKSVENIAPSTSSGSIAYGGGGVVNHASLANVTTSQHHVKYTDSAAILAVQGEATLDLEGKVTITVTPTGGTAVNIMAIACTETLSHSSGYARGLYVNYIHQTNAITGSGEINGLACDINATANVPKVMGVSIYTGTMGSITVDQIYGYYLYMDNNTSATVNQKIGISLEMNNTNPVTDAHFIKVYSHAGRVDSVIWLAGRAADNAIEYFLDIESTHEPWVNATKTLKIRVDGVVYYLSTTATP